MGLARTGWAHAAARAALARGRAGPRGAGALGERPFPTLQTPTLRLGSGSCVRSPHRSDLIRRQKQILRLQGLRAESPLVAFSPERAGSGVCRAPESRGGSAWVQPRPWLEAPLLCPPPRSRVGYSVLQFLKIGAKIIWATQRGGRRENWEAGAGTCGSCQFATSQLVA